jgi:NAD(P)-dependent dehydrogenase (short-subunit alcohol dehydrogenase family)
MIMATYAITGANRGIGLEMTRQLIDRGDQVVALCRRPSSELEATGARIVDGVDVTSDESVAAAARALDGIPIDVLVSNAGLLTRESLDDLDLDRIRSQLEVNALGPLRVSAALLPNLHAGAKIVIITSRMGSIGDNTSGGRYGYRMSKAAVNMAGVSLARDLAERRIAVGILHPGFVRTDMTGHQGMIDPPESAANLIQRIDELSMATTGTFWHANGEVLPW